VRLLLDTVTFIWAAASPELLSRKAATALANPNAIRELSAISLAELAIKQGKGKLDFRMEDVAAAMSDLRVRVLPFGADHAWALFDLPWHHYDPFDRQIIAQALAEKITVVTSDEKFKLYEGLVVIC
jgi:PIN domain nuclease of toxin-antitoxin system